MRYACSHRSCKRHQQRPAQPVRPVAGVGGGAIARDCRPCRLRRRLLHGHTGVTCQPGRPGLCIGDRSGYCRSRDPFAERLCQCHRTRFIGGIDRVAGSRCPVCECVCTAPQAFWLQATKPGARLIFPWNHAGRASVAMLITHGRNAARNVLRARSIGHVTFIAIEDGQEHRTEPASGYAADDIRSLIPNEVCAADESAVAQFDRHWFSSRAPSSFEP